MDSLQQNDGDRQQDKQESGEKEALHFTADDLGTVNCSFSLQEEDYLNPRSGEGRSAGSMSVSPRPLRKKQPQPFLVQPQANVDITDATGETDEEKRKKTMVYECCTDDATASRRLLEQPFIHLIPPTPAAVAEEDKFFEGNDVDPAPESFKSSGGKTLSVALEGGTMGENILAEAAIGAEPGERRNVEKKETLTNKEEDKEKAKSGLLRNACQVVPLHQHPLRSESPALFSLRLLF